MLIALLTAEAGLYVAGGVQFSPGVQSFSREVGIDGSVGWRLSPRFAVETQLRYHEAVRRTELPVPGSFSQGFVLPLDRLEGVAMLVTSPLSGKIGWADPDTSGVPLALDVGLGGGVTRTRWQWTPGAGNDLVLDLPFTVAQARPVARWTVGPRITAGPIEWRFRVDGAHQRAVLPSPEGGVVRNERWLTWMHLGTAVVLPIF